jgi:hypothetical protein
MYNFSNKKLAIQGKMLKKTTNFFWVDFLSVHHIFKSCNNFAYLKKLSYMLNLYLESKKVMNCRAVVTIAGF